MVPAMDWHVALLTFVLIVPVELPDKTFVAALVLATRYRPLPVWIGVGLAFGVQSLVAVTAGQLVTYLPEWVIHLVSTLMFTLGAVLLILAAPGADAEEKEQEHEFEAKARETKVGWHAALASFLLLFAAEWGDLSQLLTINMVAKYGSPLGAFVGSWAALLAVSGLAVLFGRALLRYVRLSVLHYVGGGVCAAFAVLGVMQLATA
jgi:putative Ca2+/H+ antiporter (TMEM165/GDT1 family)